MNNNSGNVTSLIRKNTTTPKVTVTSPAFLNLINLCELSKRSIRNALAVNKAFVDAFANGELVPSPELPKSRQDELCNTLITLMREFVENDVGVSIPPELADLANPEGSTGDHTDIVGGAA